MPYKKQIQTEWRGFKMARNAPRINIDTEKKRIPCEIWTRVDLKHGGRDRFFMAWIPKRYCDSDNNTPVKLGPVNFWLMGFFTKVGLYIAPFEDVNKERKNPYILVMPNPWYTTFNGGECCGWGMHKKVNDIGFILRITEVITERANADPARLYAIGYSMGGFLASWMARMPINPFAGLSLIAGTSMKRWAAESSPVPVLISHSLNDVFIKYDGCCVRGECLTMIVFDECFGVLESFRRYQKKNHCQLNSTFGMSGVAVKSKAIPDWYGVKCVTGYNCEADVKLCTYQAVGHFNDLEILMMVMEDSFDFFDDSKVVVPEGLARKRSGNYSAQDDNAFVMNVLDESFHDNKKLFNFWR